jgi:hypothetical protein
VDVRIAVEVAATLRYSSNPLKMAECCNAVVIADNGGNDDKLNPVIFSPV